MSEQNRPEKTFEELKRSEQLFRTVFDNAFEFIGLLAPDGTVLEANRTALEFIGARRAEVIGKLFWETPWWQGQPELQHRLKNGVAEAAAGKLVRFEAEHIGVDGAVETIDFSLRPIKNEAGHVTLLIPEGRRITERKRVEESLQKAWDLLQQTEQIGHVGGWEFDIDTRKQTWTDEVYRIHEVSRDFEPTVDNGIAFYAPESKAVIEGVVQRAIDLGEPFDVELAFRTARGNPRWVHAIGKRDLVGRRVHGFFQDITERKRAEEALRHSERSLQTALATAGMGTWQRDLRTGAIEWDDRVYGMYGIPRGTKIDIDLLYRRMHRDDLPVMQAAIERCVKTGADYRCDFRFIRPDDQVVWIHARGGLQRDSGGNPTHIVGVNFDVTRQRHAELALRENNERLKLALAAGEMGIWFVDESRGVCNLDITAGKLLGYGLAAVEVSIDELALKIYPGDRDRIIQQVEEAIRSGEDFSTEWRLQLPYGELRWLASRGHRMVDEVDNHRQIVGVVYDITHDKQTEELLRETDRRKDEFIATLSHELRNPLAPIRNVVNLLAKKSGLDADVERGRAIIARQVDHLSRLIDDLLDVSRITRDKLELKKARVALADIFSAAVEASRPIIDRGGHRLSVTMPAESVYLDADAVRLVQVLTNLLTNAAKYTPEPGRIVLGAEHGDGEVTLRVSDNGIGIAADQLARLFDMFYQANLTFDQTHGGLGIGLTLVQRLVQMHGGTVEVRSPGLNQGSEFIVRLPALPEGLSAQLLGRAEPTPAIGARRILVADDYGDSAETLAQLLELEGNQVRVAHDGIEALAVAEEFRPAIALLDIGMPKLDGYETARKMREQPWGREIRLIAVTGWGDEDSRVRVKKAGFDGHILKPVAYRDLIKQLKAFDADGKA